MQMRVAKLGRPVQIYTPGRDYLDPEAKALTRLPYGHPEGFYEAFANIYRGFIGHISAPREGRAAYPYPTIRDGVRGLKFVRACLKSHRQGSVWVAL